MIQDDDEHDQCSISLNVEEYYVLSIYLFYLLLYKAEKPSVRPSVCLSDRHAGISAVSAWIEAKLARNGS